MATASDWDSARLASLARALLDASDWVQLLEYTAQSLRGEPWLRLWMADERGVVELGRFPFDAGLPGRHSSEIVSASASRELVTATPDSVLVPLRPLGVAPMVLEVIGFADEDAAMLQDAAAVVASRAGFLQASDPGCDLTVVGCSGEPDRVLSSFSTSLQFLMAHDRAAIYLLTRGDRSIERFAVAGEGPLPDEQRVLPISEFGWRDCLVHDHASLTFDLTSEQEPSHRGVRLLVRAGFRSALTVPLRLGPRRLGILQLLSRAPACYGEHDVRIAQGVADHMSPFIDALHRADLARMAEVRRAVERDRTRMAAELVSVIDHLDGVGETNGAPVGDVRAQLAAAIADIAPPALRSRPFLRTLADALAVFGDARGVRTELASSGDVARVPLSVRRLTHAVLRAALAAARDAGATRVKVTVAGADDLVLTVTDNGRPGPRELGTPAPDPLERHSLVEHVQICGGRLIVDHRSDRSSTVMLELPRNPPPDREDSDDQWLPTLLGVDPPPLLRVFVIDRQGMRRAGFTRFLDADGPWRVVGHAATVAAARGSIKWLQPDVVFVDADAEDVEKTSRGVHEAAPGALIVGLASRPGTQMSEHFAAAGMASVLHQDLDVGDLVDTVMWLLDGRGDRRRPDESAIAVPALNARELAVLQRIVAGDTNSEIGDRLFLAPKTIERYVHSLVLKLRARNRAHLVSVAIGRGLAPAATD